MKSSYLDRVVRVSAFILAAYDLYQFCIMICGKKNRSLESLHGEEAREGPLEKRLSPDWMARRIACFCFVSSIETSHSQRVLGVLCRKQG